MTATLNDHYDGACAYADAADLEKDVNEAILRPPFGYPDPDLRAAAAALAIGGAFAPPPAAGLRGGEPVPSPRALALAAKRRRKLKAAKRARRITRQQST